ncbi:hypothetical protein Y032_0160g3324 [Ancylostoma ceylanicum]|nr:hypothetical protein Y032_0160g3324 [Ancylostoma ceylanicum]
MEWRPPRKRSAGQPKTRWRDDSGSPTEPCLKSLWVLIYVGESLKHSALTLPKRWASKTNDSDVEQHL